MIRNLILDWSGTLVDDFTATLIATNVVFEKFGKEAFTTEEFRRDFRLPYPDFYKEFLPEIELEQLEVIFKEAFLEAEHLVQPLAPTREFLRQAQRQGLRLLVLSSMNEEALQRQGEAFGLTPFFEAIYGGVLDKRRTMIEVVQDHGLRQEETAYVGDMVHDIHAAQAGGLTAVAVTSGYDPVDRLAQAGPNMILPNVGGLPDFCAPVSSEPRPDIVVNKLRVPVFIGVPDEEREKSQDLKISLQIETRDGLLGLSDDLAGTIDYYQVTEAIKELAASRPRKLIETLAEEIADLVVDQFQARSVQVKVEKPILMNCEGVVVAVTKTR